MQSTQKEWQSQCFPKCMAVINLVFLNAFNFIDIIITVISNIISRCWGFIGVLRGLRGHSQWCLVLGESTFGAGDGLRLTAHKSSISLFYNHSGLLLTRLI